jgi:hypothetical protein
VVGRLRCHHPGVRAPASRAVLACLLPLALLAGCSGDSGAAASSSSSSASSSSSSSSGGGSATSSAAATDSTDDDGSTDAPPFPANAEPDTEQAAPGTLATVSDIRLGRHDGFDRVVFQADGDGSPGWDVRYVAQAASQGSGKPIAVDGAAILQVTLTGMAIPADTGVAEWSGPDPLKSADTRVVTEVRWDHTFEGTSVAFVGTKGKVPFRVYSLSGPPRIVLEVRDPS